MTEERIFDGRDLTQSELDTMRRIIDEVNVEAFMEDSELVIQAVCDSRTAETISRCDMRGLAAYSADVAAQEEGDASVFGVWE